MPPAFGAVLVVFCSVIFLQGVSFHVIFHTFKGKVVHKISITTLFSTLNGIEGGIMQNPIEGKLPKRTSFLSTSHKKGSGRISRKSKYSPAKKRLRNSENSISSSRNSDITFGMQGIVNLVREKKRREAMSALLDLVEEETLQTMICEKSGTSMQVQKKHKGARSP